MADREALTAQRAVTNGQTPDAADLGLVIFASIERLREAVRIERERTAASRSPAPR